MYYYVTSPVGEKNKTTYTVYGSPPQPLQYSGIKHYNIKLLSWVYVARIIRVYYKRTPVTALRYASRANIFAQRTSIQYTILLLDILKE